MADFSALKQSIQNYIKQNGNKEITGNLLQNILLSMVTTMGDVAINDNASDISDIQNEIQNIITRLNIGASYAGYATPSTTPAPLASQEVFYLATQAGTYTNFHFNGGDDPIVLTKDGIYFLVSGNDDDDWNAEPMLVLDENIVVNSNNPVKSLGIRKYINDRVFSNANSEISLQDTLEMGSISGLDSNNWTYFDSTTRIRTKKGTYLYLLAGEVIYLTDYTSAKMFVGYKDDYTKGSGVWVTSDFTAQVDGEYVVIIEHVPTETITVEGLGALLHLRSKRLGDAAYAGVDINPTVGSHNLVESGGVKRALRPLEMKIEDIDWGITQQDTQSVEFRNDADTETIHKITDTYADFKNLKSNGKTVATEEALDVVVTALRPLEMKTENIDCGITQQDAQSVEFRNDADTETIHEITNEHADFKNLRSNGKNVATEDELDGKQDAINGLSSSSELQDDTEEIIVGDDEETQEFVGLGKYGIRSKGYFGVEGNPYKGLTFSVLGDSLGSQGITTPIATNFAAGLISRLGMVEDNCSIGGTSFSSHTIPYTPSPSDNFYFTDLRINALSVNSKVIIIQGGTNEMYWVRDGHLGTIDITNDDVNTVCGAFNVMMSKIYYKYLNIDEGLYQSVDYSGIVKIQKPLKRIHILLLTPPLARGGWGATPEMLIAVEEGLEKIAKLWGIPTIPLSTIGYNIVTDAISTDKTHSAMQFFDNASDRIVEHFLILQESMRNALAPLGDLYTITVNETGDFGTNTNSKAYEGDTIYVTFTSLPNNVVVTDANSNNIPVTWIDRQTNFACRFVMPAANVTININ